MFQDALEKVTLENIYEHLFDLYTTRAPSEEHHLGYVDRSSDNITVILEKTGIDLRIKQSLSALNSLKQPSSTGYVCWQTSIYLADWLLGDPKCPLKFLLDRKPIIVELGAGSSGILASVLGPLSATYLATDHQKHLCRLLRLNTEENVQGNATLLDVDNQAQLPSFESPFPKILFMEYDWEDRNALLVFKPVLNAFPHIILASDTIYNEYLVRYFVHSVADLLGPYTVAVVGVQLRDESILELFLECFLDSNLCVYSVPTLLLSEKLQHGFAVYCITQCNEDVTI